MTDKELPIPPNPRERNHSVQKRRFWTHASEHVKQNASGKGHARMHFGYWEFSAKQKAVTCSCWSGCESDLTRRADISVSVPNNCELCWGMKRPPHIILNEQTHPVHTVRFRAYTERLLQSCWCTFHTFLSQVWKTIWGHGQGVKQMKILQTQLHSSGMISAQITNNTAGLSRFRTDTYYLFLCVPGAYSSLVRRSYALLTHSLLSVYILLTKCYIFSTQCTQWTKLSLLFMTRTTAGGGYLCIWV